MASNRSFDGRPLRFVDRTVLVTGAGSGIGRAAAIAFAAEGAKVVVGDLDEAKADVVAAEVGGIPVAGDVRDDEVLDALVAAAGDVSVLLGNAGVLRTAPLEALTTDEFELHLAINLTANLRLVQRVAPRMRAAGGGAIVFTASLGGLRGSAGSASYNASKGALINLTRSLADELGPFGIRVNALCPGWIDTPFNDPFWAHAGAEAQDDIVGRIPLRRQGTPEDVAPAALFLTSDDAAYITGQTLVVDGGVQAT